jgi:hypothetical protein
MMMKRKLRFLTVTGLLLAALIWLSGEIAAEEFTSLAFEQKDLIPVKVYRVIVEPTSELPVVFLANSTEERALPIWIGFFEAKAINSEMQGIKHSRPLTHDLLERIIQKANGKIHKVVITHLKENSYYATLVMERGGSYIEIDARPSDSIVMALKFKAPIFVSKKLFGAMAIPLGERKGIEDLYGLIIQDLTRSLAQSFSFGSEQGVLVSDVRNGSDAEKDGIKRGDILVEVGGQAIKDVNSFRDVLGRSEIAFQAKIFRKTHFLTLTLHPN